MNKRSAWKFILTITASLAVTACADSGEEATSTGDGKADDLHGKHKRKCHLIENLSNAAATSPQGASTPKLAVGGNGYPVVAWQQGNQGIRVSEFDGVAWRRLIDHHATTHAIPDSAGGRTPSITVDHHGAPIVAWRSRNKRIHIRRFDGGKWHEIGDGSATGQGVSTSTNVPRYNAGSPSIVVDHHNRPAIAFTQIGRSGVRVRRFDGTEWQDVGSAPITTSTLVAGSHLVVDQSGELVVSWLHQNFRAFEVYARRFDGSVWKEAAPGSAMGPGVSNSDDSTRTHALATGPGGRPVLAWLRGRGQENEIQVRELADHKISPVGTGTATAPFVNDFRILGFSLTVDQYDYPAVAWSDERPNDRGNIYVSRFDGKTWREIPASKSNPGGISDSGGDSAFPSLVIDDHDNVVVAWQQFGTTGVFAHRSDVYVAVVGDQHCR